MSEILCPFLVAAASPAQTSPGLQRCLQQGVRRRVKVANAAEICRRCPFQIPRSCL